jgi:hypothetical protein
MIRAVGHASTPSTVSGTRRSTCSSGATRSGGATHSGGQQFFSRREVLKYAFAAPVLLGSGTLAATLDGPRASAAEMRLIDFAERIIPPDEIKSAGYGGVVV